MKIMYLTAFGHSCAYSVMLYASYSVLDFISVKIIATFIEKMGKRNASDEQYFELPICHHSLAKKPHFYTKNPCNAGSYKT